MSCECANILITLLGLLIALIPIFMGLKQYKNENRFKKATYFIDLRIRYKENKSFTKIREKLENEESLDDISQIELFDYAGFFEELQIAINSGFIDAKLVYYLFGYYILKFEKFTQENSRISIEKDLWIALKTLMINMNELNKINISNEDLKF